MDDIDNVIKRLVGGVVDDWYEDCLDTECSVYSLNDLKDRMGQVLLMYGVEIIAECSKQFYGGDNGQP